MFASRVLSSQLSKSQSLLHLEKRELQFAVVPPKRADGQPAEKTSRRKEVALVKNAVAARSGGRLPPRGVALTEEDVHLLADGRKAADRELKVRAVLERGEIALRFV